MLFPAKSVIFSGCLDTVKRSQMKISSVTGHNSEIRIRHKSLYSGSEEDRKQGFVAVFLVFKGEYKTSPPHKCSSKAKMLQNASCFMRKCDVPQQN